MLPDELPVALVPLLVDAVVDAVVAPDDDGPPALPSLEPEHATERTTEIAKTK